MKKTVFCLLSVVFILCAILLVGCSKDGLNSNEVKVCVFYDSGEFKSLAACNFLFDGVKRLIFSNNGEILEEDIKSVVEEFLTLNGKNTSFCVEKYDNVISIVVGGSKNLQKEAIISLPL